MKRLHFLKESLRNMTTVGTVTRSSAVLCKQMIRDIDFDQSKILVELGAGDGVVTKHILNRMASDAKLYSFEVNELFCEKLAEIKDDRLVILQRDAADIVEIMEEFGVKEVDYVVSAIPFVLVDDDVTITIINQCKKLIKEDGFFVQIHYSLVLKKLYNKLFRVVSLRFVPLNVPPAFVFTCRD